ncbi:MAG: MinD/ParA family protein [Nanoarchaeota archaeon]|nr:MinD/ParA family protein [Nanoarchaeota archaeon]
MKMGKIISVVSAKGGVGKSVLALNLVSALSSFGKDALLVDGDLSTPSINKYLNIENITYSLNDVLNKNVHFSDAIYNHSSGIKVLPSVVNLQDLKSFGAKNFSEEISNMQGFSDFVIVDSGNSLFEEVAASLVACDEVIIVTNAEKPSVENSKKLIDLANHFGKTILGVVVNMKSGGKHEFSEFEISKILAVPVFDVIPFDKKIKHSQSMNLPVVYSHPNSKISKKFKNIALRII